MEPLTLDGRTLSHRKTSIVVTTCFTQSYYTHACLEAIREWKTTRHELLVACHDASLLLEFYLKGCVKDGLIDRLILTPPSFGHTRGVNRGFQEASGDLLFNVANDILLGPAILDDCAGKLAHDPRLGLIGWHWYNDGTFWDGEGRIARYQLRDEHHPHMSPEDERNIRSAAWYTGRTFAALGGPKWLCLCNTAFFGIRRPLWDRIGGFSDVYAHYWADDFLNYAVLDQGLDFSAFEGKFRDPCYFAEFQYQNLDREDRHRHRDWVPIPSKLERYLDFLGGGLSAGERQLLYQIARATPDGATVLHVGLWRGSALILFLAALHNAHIIGIDCFDLPGISAYSAQPPVSRDETAKYITAFLTAGHRVELVQANTLTLTSFPAADAIFVDAGHSAECVEHDLRLAAGAVKPGGLIIAHDYGQPSWPAVKQVVDAMFPSEQIRFFDTLCVIGQWSDMG